MADVKGRLFSWLVGDKWNAATETLIRTALYRLFVDARLTNLDLI